MQVTAIDAIWVLFFWGEKVCSTELQLIPKLHPNLQGNYEDNIINVFFFMASYIL